MDILFTLSLFIVVIVATLFIFAYLEKKRQKRRIELLGNLITTSRIHSISSSDPILQTWVSVLEDGGYLDLLNNKHGGVIFGAKQSGLQAIMVRAVNRINASFITDCHLALYVDMNELVTNAQSHQWVSIEAIYRRLFTIPIAWYHTLALQAPSVGDQRLLLQYRYLKALERNLQEELRVPLSELNTLTIRRLIYQWMKGLGIHHITFFLDEFTSIPDDVAPVLLEFLKQIFPRGNQVTLKLGGSRDRLTLESTIAKEHIGLQIQHDVFVDLDLDGLLRSPDIAPSISDPRQRFLLNLLQKIEPVLLPIVKFDNELNWRNLFESPTRWFDLFTNSHFDVRQVGVFIQRAY